MKKILVTGSSGYIGQHLCKMLEETGLYEVHRLDINEPMGLTNDRFKCDIRHMNSLTNNTFNFYHYIRYDTVIHLAALVQVGESVQRPYDYFNTNVNGTYNVLKNLKCKNFIFASTGAAQEANSPYAMSKAAAERIIQQVMPKNATILRFYNVIGQDGFAPTNPDGLFYALINATKTGKFNLYGTDYGTKDGTAVREYIHVNDICRAILKVIENPSYELECLGYGETKSVQEIIDIFKKVNNVDFEVIKCPRRKGDEESNFLVNPSKYVERNYTYEQMLTVNKT